MQTKACGSFRRRPVAVPDAIPARRLRPGVNTMRSRKGIARAAVERRIAPAPAPSARLGGAPPQVDRVQQCHVVSNFSIAAVRSPRSAGRLCPATDRTSQQRQPDEILSATAFWFGVAWSAVAAGRMTSPQHQQQSVIVPRRRPDSHGRAPFARSAPGQDKPADRRLIERQRRADHGGELDASSEI